MKLMARGLTKMLKIKISVNISICLKFFKVIVIVS